MVSTLPVVILVYKICSMVAGINTAVAKTMAGMSVNC